MKDPGAATAEATIVRAHGEVRGTQSFVQLMAAVWRRPGLVALELLWRWVFGIPALALLLRQGWGVWMAATAGSGDPARVGLAGFALTDPFGAAEKSVAALDILLPLVLHVAAWLLPLLAVVWTLVSTVGRAAVLRRLDPELAMRPGTLLVLSALRLLSVAVAVALWIGLLTWAGSTAVAGPLARGAEPNLVGYCAMVVVGTLLLFVAWAAGNWLLSIAPMLSMLHGWTAAQSLREALAMRALRSKLFEVNLVMGIVKVALVVLAMVFSACPLPFQTYTTPGFLLWWSVGVVCLYLVASDYFHVVRAAAYLALWKALGRT